MRGLGPIQVFQKVTLNGGDAAKVEVSEKIKIEEIERRLTLTKVTSEEMKTVVNSVQQSQFDSIVLENCELSVADIIPVAGHIKSINFKKASDIRDWEKIVDLTQLETIVISEANIDSAALDKIKDLKLTTLALQACPFVVKTDFLTALAPTLKTLILDACVNIKTLAFLRGLNLETLGLCAVAGDEAEDFEGIASNQSLQSLTLVDYSSLDSLDFVASLKLSTLKVERCVRLVDVLHVAEMKKTLKTLSFAGCSALVRESKWVANLKIPDTIPPSERFPTNRGSIVNFIRPKSEIFEIFSIA